MIMKSVSLFLLCLLFTASLKAEEGYEMSMLPGYFTEKTDQMINPLADYLSEKIGIKINLISAKSFVDFKVRINNGEMDIGYMDPLFYTGISKEHDVLAIALNDKAGDKSRGLILVGSDSGIDTLQGLRHKKIMCVAKTSAGGYFSQKMTLSKNGIEVEKDCELIEAAQNSQENVIIAVSIGDMDAGFIQESALHAADEYIQPGSIKVIESCAWLPNWFVSVRKSIPEEKKKAIKDVLMGIKKGSPVLEALAIDGFQAINNRQYNAMCKSMGINNLSE